MSTLRLRFGEPVRFRFLVGMLSSAGSHVELLSAGLKFLNTFLKTAESVQKRVYLQAELEQAGFDLAAIKKVRIKFILVISLKYFYFLEHWSKYQYL